MFVLFRSVDVCCAGFCAAEQHRPRSASVGHLALKPPPEDPLDLPRGRPLTDRSERDRFARSDQDLINLLGPGRNLNIWIGTWNMNLSTNIDMDHLKVGGQNNSLHTFLSVGIFSMVIVFLNL